MVIQWLFPASTIVSSVLPVFRLDVEGVIYLSPSRSCVRSLPPDAVDPGLRVEANRTVRPDPLVRNDLVRVIPTPYIPILKEAKAVLIEKNSLFRARFSLDYSAHEWNCAASRRVFTQVRW